MRQGAEKQVVKKPRGVRKGHPAGLCADVPEGHFAKVFAALGEPTRLAIMQMLPREPRCDQMYNVVELAEELGLRQPTVSHHLKILSDAGLVASRRDCNSVYYYVDQPAVLEWMGQTKRRFGCDGGG